MVIESRFAHIPRWTVALGCALALVASGCSGPEEPQSVDDATGASAPATSTADPVPEQLPTDVSIANPERPITQLEFIEDTTEEAADRLLTFSDKIRRRDFGAAEEFLSSQFAGESLGSLKKQKSEAVHNGVQRVTYDPASSVIVGREGFLGGLRELVGPWARVDSCIWKVKGAEFGKGRGGYGKLKLFVHITGLEADGSWASLSAWGWGRAIREKGQWVLDRFDLDSLKVDRSAKTMFTEVSTAAGVAHTGPRFGQEGNKSYAFNGVASADINGDGRWDIFVPSDGRNYMYVAQTNGTFTEEAEARGLSQPDEGSGTVFFDFDNDGDQDLLVAHVGWSNAQGEPSGEPLSLFVNDGKGHFEEQGANFGLGVMRFAAYSLTVLDYDNDGWLDLFVCGYGRVEAEHNNSWIQATNGSPNGLLRNLKGKGFQDVAGQLGMQGTSWTYASAAADFDADGDIDLYVANDYGPNELFRNTGDGNFEEVSEELGVSDIGNGMGVAWGDLNSDGRLDLYVSNMSSTAGNRILGRLDGELDPETHALLMKLAAGNSIFIAQEDGPFQRREKSAGGLGGSWAWSPALCDLDLDGFLDVYCANGFVTGDQPFDT